MRARAILRNVAWTLILSGFLAVGWSFFVPVGQYAVGVLPCLTRSDRFDAEAWRSADIDDLCNGRSLMVDDLLAGDELRIGRPRAAVEALLGPTEYPDSSWVDDGLVYQTGCWIDCDWVVIGFDADGRLSEAYAHQD